MSAPLPLPGEPGRSWLDVVRYIATHPSSAMAVAVLALSLATACQLGVNVPQLIARLVSPTATAAPARP